MLQIKNLTITHSKDLRSILTDFSFSLNDGDKAVLIGEEGNGKSTLLKLIFDPALVESYTEHTGEIIKVNTKFGYLKQELSVDEKAMSALEFCSESENYYSMTPKELSDIAFQLGLNTELFFSEQLVSTLSGGEKVKLQIAKMLMNNPDILLLDEPSNDIDIDALEWLEDYINSCKLPVLYISHDEVLIERTANVIIHIEQVRRKTLSRYTVARMPYKQYVEERLNKLTHQEQVARKERSDYEKQQEKFRQIQSKVEHRQNVISRGDPHGGRLLKKKMKAVKAQERRFEKEFEQMTQIPDVEEAFMVKFGSDIYVPNGKVVLELKLPQLKVADRLLAKDIELVVTGPEKICIVGKNGVGKTTLLSYIADCLSTRKDIKMAYMPQDYEVLLDMDMTPVDYLATEGGSESMTRARTFLGSVKYTTDEMEHPISDMSGGQKAKLLFLKMILEGCNVLLLDEPSRNFSPLSSPVIRDVLKSYNGAIISTSHDRKYISTVCNKIYTLTENGLLENQ